MFVRGVRDGAICETISSNAPLLIIRNEIARTQEAPRAVSADMFVPLLE